MADGSARPFSRLGQRLALGACLALIAWNATAAHMAARGLRDVEGLGLPITLLLETASSLALVLCALSLLSAMRRGRTSSAWSLLAGLFVVLVGTWLALVLGPWSFHPARVDCTLAAAGLTWAALTRFRLRGAQRPPGRHGRLTRVLGLIVFELALVTALLEGTLRLAAWIEPRPLFAQSDARSGFSGASWRVAPGTVWWGQPTNSAGHNDPEFAERRPGRPLVALIGDSFSFCNMPRLFHYSSVLRARLPAVDVANLGIPGIGPAEYLHMVRNEAVDLRPDLVIVTIYVGNDLQPEYAHRRPHRALRLVFDGDNALLKLVPVRLAKMRTERRARAGAELAPTVGTEPGLLFSSREQALAELPWLADPRQEPTFLSPLDYRKAMTRGLRASCNPRGLELGALGELLLEMRAAARPARFAVAIWPAEFQVEERAWDVALDGDPAGDWQRARAQDLIRALCAEAGIPCLDALPALLAVEPWNDGERHVFMREETHFNARGCRVVGAELARFAAEILGLAPPGSASE